MPDDPAGVDGSGATGRTGHQTAAAPAPPNAYSGSARILALRAFPTPPHHPAKNSTPLANHYLLQRPTGSASSHSLPVSRPPVGGAGRTQQLTKDSERPSSGPPPRAAAYSSQLSEENRLNVGEERTAWLSGFGFQEKGLQALPRATEPTSWKGTCRATARGRRPRRRRTFAPAPRWRRSASSRVSSEPRRGGVNPDSRHRIWSVDPGEGTKPHLDVRSHERAPEVDRKVPPYLSGNLCGVQ